jgi:hypothetical protein
MIKLLVLTAAASSLISSGSVLAQDKLQKSLTNCTPSSASTIGSGINNAQAVEKSAILPSAGERPGSSAAPTVQRDGKTAEVSRDCPEETDVPKSGKPNG